MAAQILPFIQTSPSSSLTVSFRFILALYSIIPLAFLVYALDNLFWQQYLFNHLPSSPKHFVLFQFLFGTPHIIASTIILTTNAEYFNFYKSKLLAISLLIITIFGLGSLYLTQQALYILTVIWTVFHVLKQQFGIAKGLCTLPNWAFYSALGCSVIAGVFIYLGVFLRNALDVTEAYWVHNFASCFTVLLLFITLINHTLVKTSLGRWFLWGNSFLVLSSFYFYQHEYYFLAILIPRLVHDTTAFVIYIVHDYNRHQVKPQNQLYRLAKYCHIHCIIVLPLLSFAVTYVLQTYGDALISTLAEYLFSVDLHKAITLGFIGYLSLIHYYSEGLTWQKGSPYREFLKFKI